MEVKYLREATAEGALPGDGPFTTRATALLTELIGAPAALLTTSCTHALEMSALLLDLRPGDEVIMPSYTFASTANAYALRGAVPVFVDCRPDTLNLDERLIEAAITTTDQGDRGGPLRRRRLRDGRDHRAGRSGTAWWSSRTTPTVWAAHTAAGRSVRIGAMAAQSFHATKNIQCGEGGALVFNDPAYLDRAEILREKGTNRSQFFRGMVDKYTWVDVGSSYLPSDLLAAYLTAQLESFAEIQRQRHTVWKTYHVELADWAAAQGVPQPTVPAGCAHPAHLYYLLMPDLDRREGLLRHLADRGVHGTSHYLPLHCSPAGLRYGRVGPGGCPVTENVADRVLRLPVYAGMRAEELGRVVDAVQQFHVRNSR